MRKMQATEIMLWCACGLRRADVSVELSPAHDRCTLQRPCEDEIGSIWDTRLAANPSLYNGTKFRLAGFEHATGFGAAEHDAVKILLGISAKVSSSLILEKCLGMAWCCWQSRRNARTLRKQGITRDPRLCDHLLNLPNLEEGKVRPPI